MTELLSALTFTAAALLYGAASALFYLDASRSGTKGAPQRLPRSPRPAETPRARLASGLLCAAALGHAAYVAMASFVAHVCPIHSVHFLLSVASLFASAGFLTLRGRFRIDALGLLVSPLGLAFLLGTYFLGKPAPEPRLSPSSSPSTWWRTSLGVALFLLAGGAAALYLVQERRIKEKRHTSRIGNLPPLDTLDTAEHRFLVAGFPLLTLGHRHRHLLGSEARARQPGRGDAHHLRLRHLAPHRRRPPPPRGGGVARAALGVRHHRGALLRDGGARHLPRAAEHGGPPRGPAALGRSTAVALVMTGPRAVQDPTEARPR